MLPVAEISIPYTSSAEEFIKGIYQDDFFIEDFFNKSMIEKFLEELAFSRYLSWKTRKHSVWRSKFYLFWSGEIPDLHLFTKGSPKPFERGEVRVKVTQKGFKCNLYKYNKKIKDGLYKISAATPTKLHDRPVTSPYSISEWHLYFNNHTDAKIKVDPDDSNRILEINLEGFKLSAIKPDGYLIDKRVPWFSISGKIPDRELPTLLNIPYLDMYALSLMKKKT